MKKKNYLVSKILQKGNVKIRRGVNIEDFKYKNKMILRREIVKISLNIENVVLFNHYPYLIKFMSKNIIWHSW